MLAVFLDRDGVIVENKSNEWIISSDQLKLKKGASEAVKEINKAGLKAIIITNQVVVARGLIDEKGIKKVHSGLKKMLKPAKIDAIYYCPHHPENHHEDIPKQAMKYRVECRCRKPNIGMLEDASKKFKIGLRQCCFIGDSEADMKAAKNAGCKAILIKSKKQKIDTKPDFICNDIVEAARIAIRVSRIKGVILVGGRGERLKPLTNSIPKPMLPISGKPLIGWHLELFKKHGINDVIICGSYKFHKIKSFVKRKNFGMKIKYSHDNMTGTANALRDAKKMIDSDFIVLNGDVATNIDLSTLIRFHILNKAFGTIVIRQTDHPNDSDLVVLDGNRIKNIVRKGTKSRARGKNAMTGICIFKKDFLDLLSKEGSFEYAISEHLRKPFYALHSQDYIKDMGTLERYEKIKKEWSDKI